MKAREIAAATKQALLSGKYDFVRCNFANPGRRTGEVKTVDVRREAELARGARLGLAAKHAGSTRLASTRLLLCWLLAALPCRHGGTYRQPQGGH